MDIITICTKNFKNIINGYIIIKPKDFLSTSDYERMTFMT